MNREQYGRVVQVFQEAVEREGAERAAYLDRACSDDHELRRAVEALLAQDSPSTELIRDDGLGWGSGLRAIARDSEHPPEAGPGEMWPERVGHYRILRKLGEGGMGTVFLAEQEHPRRRVALKMLRTGMFTASVRKRFRFEIEVLGRLQHPGIAQIYEAGEFEAETGTQPYFAMEYVEGDSLARYVEKRQLDLRSKLELLARIADAVHHAHLNGVLHRDLKPDNILVVDHVGSALSDKSGEFATLGQPKVLDFGVARATNADTRLTTILTGVVQIVGTITYMSPEQALGDSRLLDARSDIYSLGTILYELLADRPPFDLQSKSIPEAMRIIREEEPTRVGLLRAVLRGDIDTIVGRALEKEREQRYHSAAGLAGDIRRFLANEPITAHPPSTFYQLRKFTRRHKQLVGGSLLLIIVLVAGLIASLTLAVRASRGEAAAQRNEYRMSLTAADAVGDDVPSLARRHLDAVPERMRGWEWRHLSARFTPDFIQSRSDLSGFEDLGDVGRLRNGRVTARTPEGALVATLVRAAGVELVEPHAGASLGVFGADMGRLVPFLSPDGAWLAAFAPLQDRLIVWRTRPEQRMCEVTLPGVESCHVCFSPDGALLVISSPEGAALHESTTGRCLFRTTPYPPQATQAVFSPDGRTFVVQAQRWGEAVLGGDDFFLGVYDVSGQEIGHRLFRSGCEVVEFSPDGESLVLGQQQRAIRILDARTLDEERILYGHTGAVTALAFSSGGTRLASAGLDLTLRVWDLEHGSALRSCLGLGTGLGPTSLTFSADGDRIAAGNYLGVRILELEQTARRVLRGHSSYVYRVAFSPDGALLASSGWDHTVRLWDVLTGDLLITLQSDEGASHIMGFLPSGDSLFGGRLWDTATGDPIPSPRSSEERLLFELQSEPSSGKDSYDPTYKAFAGGSKRVSTAGEQIALSWDRKQVAIGLPSGGVRIEDRASGRRIKELGNHQSLTVAVAFSPDTDLIASGHVDGTVRVWDLQRESCVAIMQGHADVVYSVNFSPDGARIASGANDCNIMLWDTATFEQVAVLRGHTSYVHSVCFSPDGTMIASGSGDGTVRLWDSVLSTERRRKIEQEQHLRLEMAPHVEGLLTQLPSRLDVADRLREDDTLTEASRRAALRVLLERSVSLRGDGQN